MVAFSGGLDTSCIVSWLKEDWYGFDEVVAVLVDVGQEFDLEASIERGRAAGADDVVLVDRRRHSRTSSAPARSRRMRSTRASIRSSRRCRGR